MQYGLNNTYILKSNGQVRTFVGNSNKDIPIERELTPVIVSKSITLLPTDWKGEPTCTKFEVMGCAYYECVGETVVSHFYPFLTYNNLI